MDFAGVWKQFPWKVRVVHRWVDNENERGIWVLWAWASAGRKSIIITVELNGGWKIVIVIFQGVWEECLCSRGKVDSFAFFNDEEKVWQLSLWLLLIPCTLFLAFETKRKCSKAQSLLSEFCHGNVIYQKVRVRDSQNHSAFQTLCQSARIRNSDAVYVNGGFTAFMWKSLQWSSIRS